MAGPASTRLRSTFFGRGRSSRVPADLAHLISVGRVMVGQVDGASHLVLVGHDGRDGSASNSERPDRRHSV